MLVRTRHVIDTAGADAVIAAAETAAREQGARVYICVVDPSGEIVAMRRTDGAQVASARVAVDKARTAAIFVRPSREMEEQVTRGRIGALALHGAACLTGGIPLKVGDEVVGPGAPDPLGPGEVPNRTYDVVPHAEGRDYDDSGWETLAPADTMRRLSQGRV